MSFSDSEIKDLIGSERVVIFGKGEKGFPMCGFTAQVQAVFAELYPEYKMINVLVSDDLREGMKVFSDWPTFPQVYIDGAFIGGCDIVLEMAQAGEIKL